MSEPIRQYNLFGEDITEEIKKAEAKRKRSERAKKAAETRRKNKEEKLAEFDKMFIIARSDANPFGEKYSEEEKAIAEEYIRQYKKEL